MTNAHEVVKTRIKSAKLDCKVQIHPWQREREGDGREERVEEVVDELAACVAHLQVAVWVKSTKSRKEWQI